MNRKLIPTGSLGDCTNGWGLFDMSGNLWELVDFDDGPLPRGGAYNAADSRVVERCDYLRKSSRQTAVGFRCRAEPAPI